MPISTNLMTAILSMDAYNRGYGEGILGLGGSGSQIGNATMLNVALPNGSTAAGFYASAYSWNGKTIISYRGTNADSIEAAAADIENGWITGLGFASTQSAMAGAFYTAVTGLNLSTASASTILTGHSLGGGLAGYISALTGTTGIGFDHMPFGIRAYLDDTNPAFSAFTGFR
jgi:hypothetical protein